MLEGLDDMMIKMGYRKNINIKSADFYVKHKSRCHRTVVKSRAYVDQKKKHITSKAN